MLSCVDVMRQAHVRHSEQSRPESRDLEMSLLLSLFLSGGLYFWNQHMLALIDNTQRIWRKSYIIWNFHNSAWKKIQHSSFYVNSSVKETLALEEFQKKFQCEILFFSYFSGCSNGIIRLNQICCRCKCPIIDLQVLSIHQDLLVKSYTQWVAPQGVSLWEACG